jgi:hypothetical protein
VAFPLALKGDLGPHRQARIFEQRIRLARKGTRAPSFTDQAAGGSSAARHAFEVPASSDEEIDPLTEA